LPTRHTRPSMPTEWRIAHTASPRPVSPVSSRDPLVPRPARVTSQLTLHTASTRGRARPHSSRHGQLGIKQSLATHMLASAAACRTATDGRTPSAPSEHTRNTSHTRPAEQHEDAEKQRRSVAAPAGSQHVCGSERWSVESWARRTLRLLPQTATIKWQSTY